jgi:CP family cyanate transporter-like MFS transporter
MVSPGLPAGSRSRWERVSWLWLAVLWLVGVDLRLTLLAVPPVLPLIHRDLGLSETGVGALTGLPILVLAIGSVPGSLIIARMGARRALIIGIALVAVTSGLRGVGPSAALLFGMTVVMGAATAISQPAIPSLIGRWFPTQLGLATAVYVNGLLVGEILGASLTLPVVLPLVGGSWEASLAVWAVPVLLTALLLVGITPLLPDASGGPDARWWPDWEHGTWRLGFLLGGAGAAYFGANAFIPDFLRAIGRPHLIGTCLTMLNAGQLPASFLTGLFASSVVGRRWPLLAIGPAILCSLGVFLVRSDWALIWGAGMLGFALGFALVLVLALPPMLAPADDVHRLSAGMFAISYAYSFAVPLVGGAAWDLSRIPAASFLPVAIGALTVMAGATAVSLQRPKADPLLQSPS